MRPRVSSPTFVGRQPELDRAIAAFAAARAGQTRLILVAGEAGVGKTRFVAEVAERARAAGATVLEGGSVQVGTEGLPYGPFIAALRSLTGGLSADEVDALVGSGRSELSRLMPQLIAPGAIGSPAARPDDSGQGRLFEQVLLLLGRLTQREPLVLTLEDLHWADRSSIDLLGFLVRNLGRAQVLVLATFRSDELHLGHPLLTFLAEQERSGRSERIQLNRFDRAELVAQLRGITGAQPDAELVNLILTRSDGNAFFAEELLAAGGAQARLPDTLREVLLARVATLSEPTQDLVRLAAAGGTQVSPRLLADVSGRDERELEASLREAVEKHVMVPLDGNVGDRYQFRHALVQEAVYGELLPTERSRLHAGFANALAERAYASGASQSAELAYHRQSAHDISGAFDAWLAAGVEAQRIYAFSQALAYFERALDLWDQVPDAATRAPFDRVELLTRAALLAEGADPKRSVAYIRAAIGLVDPEREPTRAGLLYERLGQYGQYVLDPSTMRAAYEEAVRLVPAAPPTAARALVLSGLSRFTLNENDAASALSLAEEALATAAAAAPEVETRALLPLGVARVRLGDVERGLATLRRARDLATELEDVHELAGALSWLTAALHDANRYEEAVTAGREAEAVAVQNGLGARWATNSLFWMSASLVALGRLDAASEALRRAEQYELHPRSQMELEDRRLSIGTLRGDIDLGGESVARLLRLTETYGFGSPRTTLAAFAVLTGDLATARKEIRSRMDEWDTQGERRVRRVANTLTVGIRAEADLVAQQGSPRMEVGPESLGIAADYLARLESLYTEVQAERPYYTTIATAFLTTGRAEFSRVEGLAQPDLWAEAAAAWKRLGMPYEQAYAQMREAEATLEQHHDRARALRALDAAAIIAADLRAAPLVRAIESLARRAGVTSSTLELASPSASFSPEPAGTLRRGRYDLTSREQDVLELVVAGLSDGQIAERLFISKKTASVHVSAIKGKLGASSRVEIVTDALALGLVESRGPGR